MKSRDSSPRKGNQVSFALNDEEEDALDKEFQRIEDEISSEPRFVPKNEVA